MDDPEAPFDRRMIIVGGGGHARVVIDVARAAGWMPIAALDPVGAGNFCANVPVVGSDEMAAHFRKDGIRFAVVALGANGLRLRLGKKLEEIGFECPVIVHPSAVLSPYARVAAGTVVMPNAVINSHARIGHFVIINTGSIVEHDCTVGDGAHVAPRSVIGGNVDIGREVLFGIGAVARPGSAVGDGATVGAGSTVIGEIDAGAVVAGVPARQIRGIAT